MSSVRRALFLQGCAVLRVSPSLVWVLLAPLLGCGAGEDLVAPISGTLEIVTSTVNSPTTPETSYAIVVDGVSYPIGLTDSLELTGLSAGNHEVWLANVPESCTTEGRNRRFVSLTANATTRLSFQVSCPPPTVLGSLEVLTVTIGSAPDPDGYSLVVDDDAARPVSANGTLMLSDLPAGVHHLRLAGLAPNCELRDTNPRVVEVPQTAQTSFEVTCLPPVTGLIVYTSDRDDTNPFDQATMDIYVRAADGTSMVNLTNTPEFDEREPVWSPDGRRIAFIPFDGDGIFVMDADGRHRQPLAATSAGGLRWSPDGSRLLFRVGDDLKTYTLATKRLQVLASDPGSTFLSGYCWSPDGRRVAYSTIDFEPEINTSTLYTISATGGAPTPIVAASGSELTAQGWSPDGQTIAYVREEVDGRDDIYLVPSDGSGSVNLTNSPGRHRFVTWSPDGQLLAFGNDGLFTITRDGVLRQLTTDDAEELKWSSDGSRLLYRDGFELFFINFDGTGRRAVTADGFLNSEASWRP